MWSIMDTAPRALLVFVDGLGLGGDDASVNPIHSGVCPTVERLLAGAAPVDAGLGVPGLPQSATGQAALLTGVNAASRVGRHVEGLPGPQLKELVREKNLFSRLAERGYSSTFANAYFTDDMEEVKARRHQSVTTVASLAAFGRVRDTARLLKNEAVYQDLTRTYLRDRGYAGPLVTPRESAEHLLAIAEDHDFTLFEYFQTDLMAHKGTPDDVRRVLRNLDEFLNGLLPFAERPNHLFLLTSDHGNIEDSTTRLHTLNPVPLVALGAGAEALRASVKSLVDFVPSLLGLYAPKT
jgi:2,3-bisphosphoglycerate-independent phosphoglycerate mutase